MIFFVAANKIIHKKQLKYFSLAYCCLLLCGVFESLVFYYSQMNEPCLEERFFTAVLFSLLPLSLVSILEIISTTKPVRRSYRIFLYILIFLNTTLNFLSCADGIIFYYTADNQLAGGKLWFLPLVFVVIYLALMIFNTSWHFKTNIWESISALFVITVTITSIPLQLFLKQNFLITTSITMALTFYFLSIHIQFFRHDPLTQLHNRKTLFLDLKKLNRSNISILTCKIENLDIFIDTSGIEASDLAVLSTVKRMEDSFEKIGRIYRTGTDEMKILFNKKSSEEINAAIDQFQEKMSTTPYSVSCKLD
ncbi:MAG: diguanylate cyclase [Treponemataceae bacterium]|nr:diguanylate cyclase [Treponemataceae bacterium]